MRCKHCRRSRCACEARIPRRSYEPGAYACFCVVIWVGLRACRVNILPAGGSRHESLLNLGMYSCIVLHFCYRQLMLHLPFTLVYILAMISRNVSSEQPRSFSWGFCLGILICFESYLLDVVNCYPVIVVCLRYLVYSCSSLSFFFLSAILATKLCLCLHALVQHCSLTAYTPG